MVFRFVSLMFAVVVALLLSLLALPRLLSASFGGDLSPPLLLLVAGALLVSVVAAREMRYLSKNFDGKGASRPFYTGKVGYPLRA